MITASAPAKINLALVVGPIRPDGLHEVVTVLQRIALCDTISLEPAESFAVEGFPGDTLVTRALQALAAAAATEPRWRVRIEKRIPVASGLGGGSSDAATALRLANELLAEPLAHAELRTIARGVGADVPFFLGQGPDLGTGDGSTLQRLEMPQDYAVLLVLPTGSHKESTAAVYARFDGEEGFMERRARVLEVLECAHSAHDLAALPPNDLASSPVAAELLAAGAFRADVSGAGPTVYGLFTDRPSAARAAREFGRVGRAWVSAPAW